MFIYQKTDDIIEVLLHETSSLYLFLCSEFFYQLNVFHRPTDSQAMMLHNARAEAQLQ